MSDDTISEAEKSAILNDFIQQTPPGQFSYVLKSVRTLVDDDALLQSQTGAKAFMKYQLEQMIPVSVDEENVLVSQQGVLASGNLLAPNSKKIFSYDPIRGDAKLVSDDGTDIKSYESSEKYRVPIAKKVAQYVAMHYPQGVSTVYAKEDSACITVTVLIECHQYQIKNFWTGNWRSAWTLSMAPNAKSAVLNGAVKVQVHYFEDGNVQLISNKNPEASINFSSADELANELTKKIADAEEKYQSGIAAAYLKFSESAFKMLRRALPVTHSKINWDQLASYKIGAELKDQ